MPMNFLLLRLFNNFKINYWDTDFYEDVAFKNKSPIAIYGKPSQKISLNFCEKNTSWVKRSTKRNRN